MMRVIGLLLVVFMVGCTQPDRAVDLLESQGYENINITGYDVWGCSQDDTYHTGFTATMNGRQVAGTVCAGFLFKGATIRFK